ncbi:MAG: hypothetical protein NT005_02685, partial [Spirochaetes bacterium]|nr:hypothetical protein [Spirochaetota bacterium]
SLGAAVFARGMESPGAALVELADSMKPDMRRVAPGPDRADAEQRRRRYIQSLAPLRRAVR